MRLGMTWAIARAEMRSVRRLTRYWVFSILALLLAFIGYMQYATIHAIASNISATVGALGPRYLISPLGLYILITFLIGLVFLAFDVRARDVRERMAEVLDARPISNLEFVMGRGAGLVLMALAPVLVLAVVVQTFGMAAIVFEWPIGEPVEPYSLAGLVFDAFSVFLFWSAAIVLLAVMIRNRLIVAVLALAFIGLQIWSIFITPVYLQTALGFISAFLPASDVLPAITTSLGFTQRMGLWVLAIGLLLLAAAFHPRLDRNKTLRLMSGTAVVALGAVIIGGLVLYARGDVEQRDAWRVAHEIRSDEARVDVQHVAGSVVIDPGNELAFELALSVAAPPDAPTGSLLFTLNPGLTVSRVLVDGAEQAWTHEQGLLDIEQSLLAGGSASVEVTAAGVPDPAFGYLDAAVNFLRNSTMNAQIALLGTEVSVFDRRYVALTPGSHWLPQSGTAVPLARPGTHPPDFFTLDLEVSVPAGWTVAGPGAREPVGDGTYRYHPGAPLPMVGLIAAEFESRSMTVRGIDFELLVHPKHQRNLDFFADSVDELERYLDEVLSVDRYGLEYPYGGMTLVEVPGTLRGYGGGWRMDSTQMMPGIVTMRENSFPTARFSNAFDDEDENEFESIDGGLPRAKIEAMKGFFENDVSGGNALQGASRNYLLYQTAATGEGALALNFVLDELVTQLVTGSANYFSPFLFEQAGSTVIGETIANMTSGQTQSVIDAIKKSAVERASVWDMALETPLVDLEPEADPRTALNVLSLKSSAIVDSILRGVGKEKIGAMLALLLERYRGQTFTPRQFTETALEAGVDLQPLIGNWLTEAALPGFVASAISVARLEDDDLGRPRYQTRFHVRNDEATPGLVDFSYKIAGRKVSGQPDRVDRFGPTRLAGHSSVEVGLLSDAPITELTMYPFLSLNREPVQLTVPRVDAAERSSAEPLLGFVPSDWSPMRSAAIYVDDLDPGFGIEGAAPPPQAAAAGMFTPAVDLDQGLPEHRAIFGVPSVWSRQQNPTSWGKYRHTAAFIGAGQGEERAMFRADIPKAGRWRLSLHVPNMAGRQISQQTGDDDGPNVQIQISSGVALGSYDVALINNGDTEAIEFDGAAAETGWNPLGEFELSAGVAEVRLTNATSGSAVVADAVRWEPL